MHKWRGKVEYGDGFTGSGEKERIAEQESESCQQQINFLAGNSAAGPSGAGRYVSVYVLVILGT